MARSACNRGERRVFIVMTVDLGDEPVGDDVDLEESDSVGPSLSGVGPFDFHLGRDSARARCRFHNRRLNTVGE